MFKFHGMPFFESGGTEVFKAASNKLFACSEKLIDNHTLMLDMRHSYMSVVFTYHWRGVSKKIVWYVHCSLLIFVAKSYWRHWTSIFMYTRHPQGGRLRHSWTTILGLLFSLLFLRSRCVYSMFRHLRRFSPLFSLVFNWNRVHNTFGCYLITIRLSFLFL